MLGPPDPPELAVVVGLLAACVLDVDDDGAVDPAGFGGVVDATLPPLAAAWPDVALVDTVGALVLSLLVEVEVLGVSAEDCAAIDGVLVVGDVDDAPAVVDDLDASDRDDVVISLPLRSAFAVAVVSPVVGFPVATLDASDCGFVC